MSQTQFHPDCVCVRSASNLCFSDPLQIDINSKLFRQALLRCCIYISLAGLEDINQSNLVPTNILETYFKLFASCSFFKKGLIAFHFSKKRLSFSKCGSFSKCAFIFNAHSFSMGIHFQWKSFKHGKGFVSLFFLFPKKL